MGLFDKVSYIEMRLQNLAGESYDMERMMCQIMEEIGDEHQIEDQLKRQCKIWQGARLKFKDQNKVRFSEHLAMCSYTSLKQFSIWSGDGGFGVEMGGLLIQGLKMAAGPGDAGTGPRSPGAR